MNYGLYLSASGVLTNLYRQDVFANNLANARTVGFKPDVPAVRQREPESIEDELGFKLRDELLDRLGGGALAGPQRVKLGAGPLIQTDGRFDLALERPNQFFAIGIKDPSGGQRQIHLTRDGRFTLDSQGKLVTLAGGHEVLNVTDRPISIDTTEPVRINARGHVRQGDALVAKIQVTEVEQPDRLIKAGQTQFRFAGEQDPRKRVDEPIVAPGYLEGSAVDPVRALLNLVEATKAVTANGNMIRYHDLIMDRTVNVLGHVAA